MRDANGEVVGLDVTKLDPKRPHVGLQAPEFGETTWKHEGSPFMTDVSRMPLVNAMSVFHDKWALTWQMESPWLEASVVPALYLTYMGTNISTLTAIQEAAIENSRAMRAAAIETGTPAAAHLEPPASMESLISSTMCAFNDSGKIIELHERTNEYACSVRYFSTGRGWKTLWSAQNEADYCAQYVDPLIKKLISHGYDCYVR